MLSTVVGQQSKEEIGIAEARPGNVADEFVTFDYFRRRFPMDFVINESNKPFEFARPDSARCGRLLAVSIISGAGALPFGGCHRNFQLNGISRT